MIASRGNGFTLIELLVALGIVAVLSSVVIVALNPNELLKQGRDSTRISDFSTLNSAFNVFATENPSGYFGDSSTTYTSLIDTTTTCANLGLPGLPTGSSYRCSTSTAAARRINGSGWLPLDLRAISFGSVLSQLPIDPVNTTSSGLYYTYNTPGSTWQFQLTSVLESQKYMPLMSADGGTSTAAYEVGTNFNLAPSAVLRRGTTTPAGPALSSISPNSASAGDPGFTLTANGSSFVTSSIINWNGSPRSTSYINSNQLLASILASDIAATGTFPVTVGTPGAGTSDPQNFTVNARIVFASTTWVADSASGAAEGGGAAIAEAQGKFYVLAGNGTATFQKYDPSGKTWTTLAPVPQNVNIGGSIVKYDNNTLYVAPGWWTGYFYKYTIGNDTWTPMTGAPGGIGQGGSLAYPGSGDFIYVLGGNTFNTFWRYSVSNDSWGQIGWNANYGSGNSLAENQGKYYVIVGNTSSAFKKYDPSTGIWTSLANLPANATFGAAITKYDSDTLFAFTGSWAGSFYKYTISTNSWTAMAGALGGIGQGGSLTYPGSGDYIYAIEGNNRQDFYRYSVSGNTWVAMANVPVVLNGGAALTSLNSSFLYALGGGTNFYQYSIASDTWVSKASVPTGVCDGGSLSSDGINVYALRGCGTNNFYEYTVGSNSWSSLTSFPTTVGANSTNNPKGGIAYSPTIGRFFAVSGTSDGQNASIFEYNAGTNLWPMAGGLAPAGVTGGGALTALNSNSIYAFLGNNTTNFYLYDIASGTWNAKASAPLNVQDGGSLTTDGTNIYAFRGSATPTFWMYSPSSNTWSTLSSMLANVGLADTNARGGLSYSSTLNDIFGITGNSGTIYKNGP